VSRPGRELERIDVGDGVVVELHRVRGGSDGPVLTVLGGVHGDELEGVAAARMLLAELDPAALAGELRVVPVVNPPAFAARTRTSPLDGANLARIFPGDPAGSVSERIAHAIATRTIRDADLLVDLHSAGRDYAMPWFAGYVATGAPGEAEAARAFGAPLVWEHDSINPGRTISTAAEHGVPAVYVEGGGGGALLREEVAGNVAGTRAVMALLGMLDEEPPHAHAPHVLRGGAGNVDASLSCAAAGWCSTAVFAGDVVERGELIAEVIGEDGRIAERVVAPVDGTIMLLRRRAEVAAGDAIAMLGPVPE
jgi:predicted deacylase